jgi:monofunctional biosynthetic peptidoglycan transglycosylase
MFKRIERRPGTQLFQKHAGETPAPPGETNRLPRYPLPMARANRWRVRVRAFRRWWHRRSVFARFAVGAAVALFALLAPLPIIVIFALRFLPVPFTPQMAGYAITGNAVHYSWVGYDSIAPALERAVIASEDDNFCSHHGFDWKSIDKALKAGERGKHLRGASTISQQTARSVFLAPIRSWVRKGAEAWLTVLMEALWPKQRILTVYLNVVDWGHGNFGAEAAAQNYFHRAASALTAKQAARLATILPDPDVWKAAHPGPYVAARSATILARMGEVARDRLDACVRR